MDGKVWLMTVIQQFEGCQRLSERALEQVTDTDFFAEPSPGANSLGVLVKHMGGNLRSRWLDFLTTDGEKPDRRRDREFETEGKTRAEVEALWETGWGCALGSLRNCVLSTSSARSPFARSPGA